MKYDLCTLVLLFICSSMLFGQNVETKNISVTQLKQQTFPNEVPAGNYSGLVHLYGNRYALVSDKSPSDGFYIFDIVIDSVSGKINHIEQDDFLTGGISNRDEEGITFRKSDSTIFVSGERDNRILQYTLDGKLTGRELEIPSIYKNVTGNYGFESLSYNNVTHMFWTANESSLATDGPQATSENKVENIIRIQSFDDALKSVNQYLYRMDAPVADGPSSNYAMGVSELLALDNGSLLVLEREFYVPPAKLGAFVNCKLYQVWPKLHYTDGHVGRQQILAKYFITQIHTTLSLFNYSIANYEGMCLGPKLADGRQTIIMVSDSQNQYAGVLKDWFKVLVID